MDTEAFLVARERLRQEMGDLRVGAPQGPSSLTWLARAAKFYFLSKGVIKKVVPVNTPIVRFLLSTVVMKLASNVLPTKILSFWLYRKLFKG